MNVIFFWPYYNVFGGRTWPFKLQVLQRPESLRLTAHDMWQGRDRRTLKGTQLPKIIAAQS
jgi:hypothetical protein